MFYILCCQTVSTFLGCNALSVNKAPRSTVLRNTKETTLRVATVAASLNRRVVTVGAPDRVVKAAEDPENLIRRRAVVVPKPSRRTQRPATSKLQRRSCAATKTTSTTMMTRRRRRRSGVAWPSSSAASQSRSPFWRRPWSASRSVCRTWWMSCQVSQSTFSVLFKTMFTLLRISCHLLITHNQCRHNTNNIKYLNIFLNFILEQNNTVFYLLNCSQND